MILHGSSFMNKFRFNVIKYLNNYAQKNTVYLQVSTIRTA